MARPIGQRLRFWERAWAKAKARHEPKQIAILALGGEVSAEQKAMIETSLAFSSSAIRVVVWESGYDIVNFVDEVVDAQARYFIAVGRKLTRGQKRVLRYLEVEFIEFDRGQIDGVANLGAPFSDNKIRQLKERRNAIYMHKPLGAEVGVILRAFAETKRRYPDLVLLLTGVAPDLIEEIKLELLVAHVSDPKSKLKLCDIIYDAEEEWQNAWAAAANVTVLVGRESQLDQRIEESMALGAAVVVLGAPKSPARAHDELESRGLIWSVKRPQGLAPALAQALEPEKTALTVMQAMDYFHGQSTVMQNMIDDMLARAS